MARRLERPLREFLSDWHFWVSIAYIGLAFLTVWLYVLNGREARAGALRAAAIKSAATSQVSTCFTAVRNAPVTHGFVLAQAAIVDNGILGNESALARARPDDPLNPVRRASLARLRAAKANARSLRALIESSTPSRAKCVTLAKKLKIDPQQFEKG